jgi:hypothetical protein
MPNGYKNMTLYSFYTVAQSYPFHFVRSGPRQLITGIDSEKNQQYKIRKMGKIRRKYVLVECPGI